MKEICHFWAQICFLRRLSHDVRWWFREMAQICPLLPLAALLLACEQQRTTLLLHSLLYTTSLLHTSLAYPPFLASMINGGLRAAMLSGLVQVGPDFKQGRFLQFTNHQLAG